MPPTPRAPKVKGSFLWWLPAPPKSPDYSTPEQVTLRAFERGECPAWEEGNAMSQPTREPESLELWKRVGREIRSAAFPQKGVIAIVPTPQHGGVFECEDNLRLIVQAPAMRKALTIFRDDYDGAHGAVEFGVSIGYAADRLRAALRAIEGT